MRRGCAAQQCAGPCAPYSQMDLGLQPNRPPDGVILKFRGHITEPNTIVGPFHMWWSTR